MAAQKKLALALQSVASNGPFNLVVKEHNPPESSACRLLRKVCKRQELLGVTVGVLSELSTQGRDRIIECLEYSVGDPYRVHLLPLPLTQSLAQSLWMCVWQRQNWLTLCKSSQGNQGSGDGTSDKMAGNTQAQSKYIAPPPPNMFFAQVSGEHSDSDMEEDSAFGSNPEEDALAIEREARGNPGSDQLGKMLDGGSGAGSGAEDGAQQQRIELLSKTVRKMNAANDKAAEIEKLANLTQEEQNLGSGGARQVVGSNRGTGSGGNGNDGSGGNGQTQVAPNGHEENKLDGSDEGAINPEKIHGYQPHVPKPLANSAFQAFQAQKAPSPEADGGSGAGGGTANNNNNKEGISPDNTAGADDEKFPGSTKNKGFDGKTMGGPSQKRLKTNSDGVNGTPPPGGVPPPGGGNPHPMGMPMGFPPPFACPPGMPDPGAMAAMAATMGPSLSAFWGQMQATFAA